MTNETTSAPAFLDAAAKHMRDRAATYDKPGGERSMAKTVAAFNAITGHTLSTAEGWLLLQVLKQVRAFTNSAVPHRDSLEDSIAYGALLAEEMLGGGEPVQQEIQFVEPAGHREQLQRVVQKAQEAVESAAGFPPLVERCCATCKNKELPSHEPPCRNCNRLTHWEPRS